MIWFYIIHFFSFFLLSNYILFFLYFYKFDLVVLIRNYIFRYLFYFNFYIFLGEIVVSDFYIFLFLFSFCIIFYFLFNTRRVVPSSRAFLSLIKNRSLFVFELTARYRYLIKKREFIRFLL